MMAASPPISPARKKFGQPAGYFLGVGFTLLLSGCQKMPSALDSVGPQAGRIEDYWWLIFWISAVVLGLVVAAMFYAVLHRDRVKGTEPEPFPEAAQERQRTRLVSILVGLTILVLAGLLTASLRTDRALATLAVPDAVPIEVIGHQWWWEIRYPDAVAGNWATTANEIHVPVGRMVEVRLVSNDVIHSFWVPNLAGKMDLIPGHDSLLNFRADRAGVFRGQCAEFCGYQHAKMAFLVVADPPERFSAWLDRQRASAAEPTDPEARRGQEVFLSKDCGFCHSIQGTTAAGRAGPDLTHVAGRSTLAAATLPNGPGNLAGWIVDPQRLKPGNHMPPHALKGPELAALVAYLGSLQ